MGVCQQRPKYMRVGEAIQPFTADELADSFSQPLGLFQLIGQLLARYQADGVLKPENPLHGVATLLGPLIYLSMIERSAADLSIPPIDIERHIASFLAGRSVKDRGIDNGTSTGGAG